MNGETAWALYETRLRRVTAYIHEHLDEELDMDRLAEIACLSSYHWHRIYRAIYGETLAATVKRLRLHRAAGDIVRTSLPIGEIAGRSGYPNLQSFNRIFKTVYGMPPARYRKEGSHSIFQPLSHGRPRPCSMSSFAPYLLSTSSVFFTKAPTWISGAPSRLCSERCLRAGSAERTCA